MLRRVGALFLAFTPVLFADIGGTVTIPLGSTFDFDTGTAGASGGDILWDGGSVVAQGNATIGLNPGPTSVISFVGWSLGLLEDNGYYVKTVPIAPPPFRAAEFTAFEIVTDQGHHAKGMALAVESGSLTLLYYTWEATNSSGIPVVMQVQNNYSYTAPGFPNYGIAPGSLFIIKGVNLSTGPLSALQSSASPGLPLTLNGTSVSVTVNGVTTHPAIYYTSPGQLGVVLPSTTPPGTGTIAVTNGTTSSLPVPIQVVQSALGLDALYGTGVGPAVATDANGNLLTFVNSAAPNQAIVLWGSGVGPDPANDDRTYPQSENNLAGVPFQVFIGGVQAQVAYRGRSQYPGVDQINVVVPASVTPGCYVSVQTMSGTVVSNIVTLSVAASGGPCSDPLLGIGPAQAQLLSSTGTVNVGELQLPAYGDPYADASFMSYPNGQFGEDEGYGVSAGSCIGPGTASPSGGPGLPYSPAGLDPGKITAAGPGGSVVLKETGNSGFFSAFVQTQANTSPAAYTFDNGSGGTNIGHFHATVTPIAGLTGSNVATITSITRSQGVTVTWTGGAPGTLVQITGLGSITTPDGWQYEPGFTCAALVEAGQFTVPASVLSAFSGYMALGVSNSLVESFAAPGLDWGYSRVTGSGYGSNGVSIVLQ